MFSSSLLEPASLSDAAAYAGIGSRETPADILALMEKIAVALRLRGFTMRSGGAPGADSAFEAGTPAAQREIFLPWRSFNGRSGALAKPGLRGAIYFEERSAIWQRAATLAERYHPAWDRLSRGGRALQTRNSFQVLGADLESPSRFIVAWTKDGKATGGTGQAIRMAEDQGIPVINLQPADHRAWIVAELGLETPAAAPRVINDRWGLI